MENKNIFVGFTLFGSSKGEHVSGAGIYLETGTDQELVVFQKTGGSGKVTLAHLDKGTYNILLDTPRQKGKLEVKDEWIGDMQVGYHSDKSLFLFQEATGYFSVKFTKLHNLANSNITPMYERDNRQHISRILIGKLEVDRKYGSLTLELNALSQKQFIKLTDKYQNDTGMSIIRKSR